MLDDQSRGETRLGRDAERPSDDGHDILQLRRTVPDRDPDDAGSDEDEPRARAPAKDREQKSDDAARTDTDDDEAEDEADEKKPSFIRRHPLGIALGALLALLLVAAAVLYWVIFVHPYETTDDAFVDARSYAVAPKVNGYIVDVPVTDNQHVDTGAILFQIDQRDYRTALDQANAQIQAAKASIESAQAQIKAQEASIEESKAQVQQAQAALQFARQDAARYQELAQRGAGTVQQSQQSSSNQQQQEANLARANAGVNAAQQQIGSLRAQQANAEATLAQGKAQAEQSELNLSYTTIRAAQPGRIVRLTGAKGQYLQVGQSVTMFEPDDRWVTANYKETQINDMRPGQPVRVRIDAYPDRKITGRVASVQPGSGTAFSLLPAENATGNYIKVVQRIPVKIVVDQWPNDVSIGPGMSIVPTVTVREEPTFYRRWFGDPSPEARDTDRTSIPGRAP